MQKIKPKFRYKDIFIRNGFLFRKNEVYTEQGGEKHAAFFF